MRAASQLMKTLMTLSVLQTIGIALLVVHAFREEHHSAPAAPAAQSAASLSSSDGASRVDEERLRAILREELAQEHIRPVQEPIQPDPARPRTPSPAELQQRDVVAQQIEAYRGTGTITDAQMLELQADIAQLDAASRRQMLSKLTRALNTGEIKGRL
jgi:hypothetical protein